MAFADHYPGFRLRITRWGLGYLIASVILGLAAVNTGNNALMALLGVALGSYVVSGTWSRQVLGNINAAVKLPSEVFAGRPAVVEIELANGSKVFPAYGLVIRDEHGRAVVTEPLLVTGGRSSHTVETVFPERGWHGFGPWRLEVSLPLGFFVKSKMVAADQRVLVYPRLLPNSAAAVRRGGGRRSPDALESRGREGEVTQLRDFREGDDVRSVHWKQTARQQRLVVVERQRASEKPVFFVVDPRVKDPTNQMQLDRFERLVSEVATGVVRRLKEGVRVGLVVGQTVVPPVRASRRSAALLRPLAEVEPMKLTDPPPADVAADRRMVFSTVGAVADGR